MFDFYPGLPHILYPTSQPQGTCVFRVDQYGQEQCKGVSSYGDCKIRLVRKWHVRTYFIKLRSQQMAIATAGMLLRIHGSQYRISQWNYYDYGGSRTNNLVEG